MAGLLVDKQLTLELMERFIRSPKASTIEVGATYSVTGGVSKFNTTFQIMIGNQNNQGLMTLN